MDNVMISIRDFFVNFIISVKPYWAFIAAILSFCSTILTCIGKSLSGILISPKNWKYGSVINYKIVKAQRDIKYDIDIWNPVKSLLIEMLKIVEILLAICIFLYFVVPFIDGNESNENKIAYVCILACIIITNLSALICKRIKKENIPPILSQSILLLIINCFGLCMLVVSLDNHNVIGIYIIMILMSICNLVIIEFGFFKDMNNYITKKLKILRYIGGIFYIIHFFVAAMNNQDNNTVNMFFFYGWIVLCVIENIYSIVKMNDAPEVEFQINLNNREVNTKGTIYQYQCNKVKYSLKDGTIEIINDDNIDSIDYTKRYYISTKKKTVICILKTREKMDFDGCKFIKDSWVSFYKIDDKGKHIKVVNMNKIKKIVIK